MSKRLITSLFVAIQLAKLSGFSPIITTTSTHNFDLVRSLGATHVLNRKLPLADILVQTKEITTKPIKIIYDAVSNDETEIQAHTLLAPGGQLVLDMPATIPEAQRTPDKEVIHCTGSGHWDENRAFAAGLYDNITRLLECGNIKVRPGLNAYGGGRA